MFKTYAIWPRITPNLITRALDGDIDAQRPLVETLTPEIHGHVAAMLRIWPTSETKNLHGDMEDLVHKVFLELWDNEGQILRAWNPERLSLEAFVGHVARRLMARHLLSRRKKIDPAGKIDPLRWVLLCLRAGFEPEDVYLFELLLERQESPEKAAEMTGLDIEAIADWRRKLERQAQECRRKMSKQEP